MLVFEERGNRSTWRKTSRSRVENQQTQPTYDAKSRNQTWATLMGGGCSHHCAIPAPQLIMSYIRYSSTLSDFLWTIRSITAGLGVQLCNSKLSQICILEQLKAVGNSGFKGNCVIIIHLIHHSSVQIKSAS